MENNNYTWLQRYNELVAYNTKNVNVEVKLNTLSEWAAKQKENYKRFNMGN